MRLISRIGMANRSYHEPDRIELVCQGCFNVFLGAPNRQKWPACRICLKVEAEHGRQVNEKNADKARRRAERDAKAAANNPAWRKTA